MTEIKDIKAGNVYLKDDRFADGAGYDDLVLLRYVPSPLPPPLFAETVESTGT